MYSKKYFNIKCFTFVAFDEFQSYNLSLILGKFNAKSKVVISVFVFVLNSKYHKASCPVLNVAATALA